MAGTGVRLARGGTTMWRAWVGFNFSHSLGALVFGAGCIAAGLLLTPAAMPRAWLLIPVVVSSLYVVMAIKYWFRIPAIGTAIATAMTTRYLRRSGAWEPVRTTPTAEREGTSGMPARVLPPEADLV